MKDEPIDRAIRNTLADLPGAKSDECPADGAIAAYLEFSLRAEERAEVESHMARCASCREVLALSMQLGEEDAQPAQAAAVTGKKILFHISIPVSAVALIIVGTVAGVLYYRAIRTGPGVPAAYQTAELKAPAPGGAVNQALSRQKLDQTPKAAPKEEDRRKPADIPVRVSQPPAMSPAPPLAGDDAKAYEALEKFEAVTRAPEKPAQLVETERLGVPAGAADNMTAFRDAATVSASREPRMAGARASIAALEKSARVIQRTVGDKTFILQSGIWMDGECANHPDVPVVEIQSGTEEHSELLKAYPGLGNLRPALVFWKGKKISFK